MQIKRINAWFRTATRADVNNLLGKIPLFSPTEKVLKITAEDIEKLLRYIQTNE